jgi:hypothetical protein
MGRCFTALFRANQHHSRLSCNIFVANRTRVFFTICKKKKTLLQMSREPTIPNIKAFETTLSDGFWVPLLLQLRTRRRLVIQWEFRRLSQIQEDINAAPDLPVDPLTPADPQVVHILVEKADLQRPSCERWYTKQ